MSHAATCHLDGELLASSIRIGVLAGSGSPVARFEVVVGPQAHVVWALDAAAAKAYAYAVSTREHYSGEDGRASIQVNVSGFPLRTADDGTALFAQFYTWHTSKRIREAADRMIALMARQWPSQEILHLPTIPLPQQKGVRV